jgi:hypothetical protein
MRSPLALPPGVAPHDDRNRRRLAQRQEPGTERERHRVRPVPGSELRDHPLAVALHGLRGEEEPGAGLSRGLALGGAREDLALAGRERLAFQDLL